MADKKIGHSPFIEAVAGDGSAPPDVRMLSGWFGNSGEDGHVRLYLDAGLTTFADIPRDAILYSEEIPNSHPAGQRTVWIKQDAELKEGGSALSRAAKFLRGDIQRDFQQTAAAGQAAQQIANTRICLTVKPGCEPSVHNPCITRTEIGANCPHTRLCSAVDNCPSALRECDTRGNQICIPQTESGARCVVSAVNACPSLGACGSAVDACPSALGCSIACGVDWTIAQQTPVLQQRQFAQQFVGVRPNPTVTLPPPNPTNACVTITGAAPQCCPLSILCPAPNPSVGHPCSTQVPALCPDPRFAAVSGPGWTCYCPPQHSIYPQCPTGHTGCVTFPCWAAGQQQNAGIGAEKVGARRDTFTGPCIHTDLCEPRVTPDCTFLWMCWTKFFPCPTAIGTTVIFQQF